MGNNRARLRWLLRWSIAFALLALVIVPHRDALRGAFATPVDGSWLLVGFLLRATSLVSNGFRWRLLLKLQELELPGWMLTRLVCAGFVTNYVVPGTIGGDATKAVMLTASQPGRRLRAAGTIVVDRMIGLLSLVLLGAVAGVSQWNVLTGQLERTAVAFLIVLASGGLLTLLLVQGSWFPSATFAAPQRRIWVEIARFLGLLREHPRAISAALAIGLFSQICVCLTFACCLLALGAAECPLSFGRLLWMVPAAEVVTAALPMPGGLGAREGALMLVSGSGADTAGAREALRTCGLTMALLFNALSVSLALACGLCLGVLGWRSTGAEAPEG